MDADSNHRAQQDKDLSVEFVDPSEVPERLFCVKCRIIMCNPFVITTCGHNICNQCVLKLTDNGSGSGQCPGEECYKYRFDMSEIRRDHGLKRDLQNARVYCPHRQQGCDDQITYGTFEQHKKLCMVGRLADTDGGVSLDMYKQLTGQIRGMQQEIKILKEVKGKQIEVISDLTLLLEDIKTTHLTNQVQMTWKHTGDSSNGEIESPLKEIKVKVDTQYGAQSNFGTIHAETCVATTTSNECRKTPRQVNETLALHDVTLADHDIRFQCLENASFDGKLVWKIANLSDHMEKAKSGKTLSLFSQPFYTDVRGYKMRGRLYLNGDGPGKGAYISLYFMLMKGTYDDLLQWPFSHKVTLGAIDVMTGGQKTILESFKPNPKSSSYKKPVTEMNIASGCPKFVSHNDLLSGPYVKDDTFYLTIQVGENYIN